jgi:hypothetical protein
MYYLLEKSDNGDKQDYTIIDNEASFDAIYDELLSYFAKNENVYCENNDMFVNVENGKIVYYIPEDEMYEEHAVNIESKETILRYMLTYQYNELPEGISDVIDCNRTIKNVPYYEMDVGYDSYEGTDNSILIIKI